MNAAGEEWGDERLMQVIAANRALTAPALIDCIMRAADTFAAGAAQYDDMTLIAARLVGAGGHRVVS